MSYNKWVYTNGNPVNYSDPSGKSAACGDGDTGACGDETADSRYFEDRLFYERCAKYGGGDCPKWGEIILYTALGLTGIALISDVICPSSLLPISETAELLCQDGDCSNEIDVTVNFGKDIWRMNPFERGRIIEEQIGRSPDLVENFPVIDRWEDGIVTSIKSLNLNSNSYQNPAVLSRVLDSYSNKISNFTGVTWGNVTINSGEIMGRQLLVCIPANYPSFQINILLDAYNYAKNLGVQLAYIYVR